MESPLEQCSQCGSLNSSALNKDGSRYDPFLSREEQVKLHGHSLWCFFRCDECGHLWPFTFIVIAEAAA